MKCISFFFFSSRRRHTRWNCDWSSDVCSSDLDIGTPAEAEAFKAALESAAFTVANVEAKPARRNPPAPFTTSTLQQEASRKLGFAPAHTMRIAQRLRGHRGQGRDDRPH